MADTASAPALTMTAPIATGTPVLSFPAILRNPGLTSRFAHLQGALHEQDASHRSSNAAALKKNHRDQNDGKRWLRRRDNAHFVGNPHIVAATRRDYGVAPPQARSTFPEPLPEFLPRTVKLPASTQAPPTNPASANAGRFSLSLKGMRKELRRQGGRAEALVRDVDDEMLSWLGQGGTVLNPDRENVLGPNTPNVNGIFIGNTRVVEVSRTPLQLVWRIPDDAFARYVVHCCARYHEIVSFSKGNAEERLTYLLRPNVTRPDHHARGAMDTPPATESEYYSNTESNIDSDFISDHDFESDIEVPSSGKKGLTAIDEGSNLADDQSDTWSLVGDADADVESNNESELEAGIEALSLSSQPLAEVKEAEDPDKTMTSPLRPSHRPYPLTAARRMLRSASSPSRSPVRMRRRRGHKPALATRNQDGGKRTFYEFVFV